MVIRNYEKNPTRNQFCLLAIHNVYFDLNNATDDSDDDISEAVEIRWKLGPPHPNAERLLLRLATKSE